MENNFFKNSKSSFSLTSFQLKMIALITMIMDHFGIMFQGFNGADLSWMRVVGRISFPLFAFLISEGCRHTKNIKKYMLRLFISALLAQVCYIIRDIYLSMSPDSNPELTQIADMNVFFTLLLGVVAVYSYEKILKQKRFNFDVFTRNIIAITPVIGTIALAYYADTDYGAIGVFMIFTAYLAKTKPYKILAVFISILLLYYGYLTPQYLQLFLSGKSLNFLMPFSAMISLIFIYLYNEKLGRNWKWFFYIAYPGHFAILGLLYLLAYHFLV